MLNKSAKKIIANSTKARVTFDHNLSRYTSFRIGGPADAIVFPENIKEVIDIVSNITTTGIPLTILGSGSNTLIKDHGIRGVVMIISGWENNNNPTNVKNNFRIIKVHSGINMRSICAFSIKNGLSGIDFALGIPGTIGGAIIMNAGTQNGSISDVLHSITILNKNGIVEKLTGPFKNFSYRNWNLKKQISVILECEIILTCKNKESIKKKAKQILTKRKKTQPIASANAGCFFKNPAADISAGNLIDKAGLKGKQIGDAIISDKHANFIINVGKATASDVLKLADLAQKSVFKQFQITLEPEVHILGSKNR